MGRIYKERTASGLIGGEGGGVEGGGGESAVNLGLYVNTFVFPSNMTHHLVIGS